MRILATGDHHFEEGQRFSECCRVHDWIAEYVKKERPDVYLDAGDVYEKASTPVERLEAASFYRRVADVCPVIIARGNHDRPRDLQILASLRSRHFISVVEDAEVFMIAGVGAIAVCAWPTRASDIDEEGSRESLRAVLRGLGDELSRFDGPRILLGHFMVDGSMVGPGQPRGSSRSALIGGGLGVSIADLALARAHAVVMGHIHKAQEWVVAGVPMLYTGSSHRTDFGEMEEKSILDLDVDDRGSAIWRRIQTPARPMILVEGQFDPNELGILTDLHTDTSVEKADIRLHYTTPLEHVDHAIKHAEALRAIWYNDGAATVKLDREVVATSRARSIEVSKARTLADKVRAHWTARNDVPEPMRAARLINRIEAMEAR